MFPVTRVGSRELIRGMLAMEVFAHRGLAEHPAGCMERGNGTGHGFRWAHGPEDCVAVIARDFIELRIFF